MPKKKTTKSKISITIDKELLEIIGKECKDRTMKLSSYLEKLIRLGYENEKRK